MKYSTMIIPSHWQIVQGRYVLIVKSVQTFRYISVVLNLIIYANAVGYRLYFKVKLCKFGIHKMKEIYIGPIVYDWKRNKPPLSFKGIWEVRECEDCGQQEAEQQKEKDKKEN